MPPKITDSNVWQQAETLMQPAFIRLIDNIRKQLDVSNWKGTYQDVLVWAPGTSEETKAMVTSLVEELETATPERTDDIKQTLAKLPMPHPGYHLCLQRQEQREEIDLWELCYQVCFQNYPSSEPVYIDTSLIDEQGEVDWNTLDVKAKQIVDTMFQNLP
ncbi:hypothetical protein NIES4071_71060 [Calothrix sp. NIES-4071]|nr:hypothetical protein NIES4071_71060 [Calothrix sp. NIES-4071]BAZ61381.1 hypothetical protein NIES4105_71010 [Calothrix sp. NIES-4105]